MFCGQLMGSPSDGEVIDEFTRRKAVFREKWNRHILLDVSVLCPVPAYVR